MYYIKTSVKATKSQLVKNTIEKRFNAFAYIVLFAWHLYFYSAASENASVRTFLIDVLLPLFEIKGVFS